jgi:hypothetical protein
MTRRRGVEGAAGLERRYDQDLVGGDLADLDVVERLAGDGGAVV